MSVQQQADNHEPGPKWEFNADVAAKFDSMLNKSIPGYPQMRELCFDLGKRFISGPHCNVIDLGASRGESSAHFIDAPEFSDARYVLSEVSAPMREQMETRWGDRENVHIVNHDLRQTHDKLSAFFRCPVPSTDSMPTPIYKTTLVQAILTLIFVPINFRQAILKGVYDGLDSGGAFIMVEKVLGNSAEMQDLLVDSYHEYKNRNGYSWESIERKRAALEGVQVPVRHEENMAMLRSAGFRNVETFWRHLNFVGYIAVKD